MKYYFQDRDTRPFAIIICILLAVLIACCVWFFFAGEPNDAAERKPGYYSLDTQVSSIDNDTDLVTCEDGNGNLWEFYGINGRKVGDKVALLMDNMGTTKIEDDEICGATYGTWIFEKTT